MLALIEVRLVTGSPPLVATEKSTVTLPLASAVALVIVASTKYLPAANSPIEFR